MLAVQLENANRMMTQVEAKDAGIELLFADAARGLIPFADIPEVGGLAELESIELPNAYEVILHPRQGKPVELPWDFARHYCDPAYRPRIEALAKAEREALGARIRRLRLASGLTQAELAAASGVGRVTLVRIENGEQSPKYDTLMVLARAMGLEPADLL